MNWSNPGDVAAFGWLTLMGCASGAGIVCAWKFAKRAKADADRANIAATVSLQGAEIAARLKVAEQSGMAPDKIRIDGIELGDTDMMIFARGWKEGDPE